MRNNFKFGGEKKRGDEALTWRKTSVVKNVTGIENFTLYMTGYLCMRFISQYDKVCYSIST